MKKLPLTFVLLFLLVGFRVLAQTYEVPKGYVLKAKEDFPKYEADVISTIDWLQQTSWSEQLEKRKEANTFFIAWISGSPDISIEVNHNLTDLCDKNKELLVIYMCGYTKYALQNKSAFEKNTAIATGLKALLKKYGSEGSRIKDKKVEHLLKIESDGKLDEWIKTDFYKS